MEVIRYAKSGLRFRQDIVLGREQIKIVHTYLDPSFSACYHGVLDNSVKPPWQLAEHIKEGNNSVQNLRFPNQYCLGLRPSWM